jgi:hypothetical protein
MDDPYLSSHHHLPAIKNENTIPVIISSSKCPPQYLLVFGCNMMMNCGTNSASVKMMTTIRLKKVWPLISLKSVKGNNNITQAALNE